MKINNELEYIYYSQLYRRMDRLNIDWINSITLIDISKSLIEYESTVWIVPDSINNNLIQYSYLLDVLEEIIISKNIKISTVIRKFKQTDIFKTYGIIHPDKIFEWIINNFIK